MVFIVVRVFSYCFLFPAGGGLPKRPLRFRFVYVAKIMALMCHIRSHQSQQSLKLKEIRQPQKTELPTNNRMNLSTFAQTDTTPCRTCRQNIIRASKSLTCSLFAVWTGLEPATPCVTGRYSNQLNYHTVRYCRALRFLAFAVQNYNSFSIFAIPKPKNRQKNFIFRSQNHLLRHIYPLIIKILRELIGIIVLFY